MKFSPLKLALSFSFLISAVNACAPASQDLFQEDDTQAERTTAVEPSIYTFIEEWKKHTTRKVRPGRVRLLGGFPHEYEDQLPQLIQELWPIHSGNLKLLGRGGAYSATKSIKNLDPAEREFVIGLTSCLIIPASEVTLLDEAVEWANILDALIAIPKKFRLRAVDYVLTKKDDPNYHQSVTYIRSLLVHLGNLLKEEKDSPYESSALSPWSRNYLNLTNRLALKALR